MDWRAWRWAAAFIVIVEEVGRPGLWRQGGLNCIQEMLYGAGMPGHANQAEIEGHVEFIELLTIITCPYWPVVDVHLAERDTRGLSAVGIEELAKIAIDGVDVVLAFVIEMELGAISDQGFVGAHVRVGVGRIIA